MTARPATRPRSSATTTSTRSSRSSRTARRRSPQFAVKGRRPSSTSARSSRALLEVFYSYDGNVTRYSRAPDPESPFEFVFGNFNQLGVNARCRPASKSHSAGLDARFSSRGTLYSGARRLSSSAGACNDRYRARARPSSAVIRAGASYLAELVARIVRKIAGVAPLVLAIGCESTVARARSGAAAGGRRAAGPDGR